MKDEIKKLPLPEAFEYFAPLLSKTGEQKDKPYFLLNLAEHKISAKEYSVLLSRLPYLPCPTIVIASPQLLKNSSDLLALFDVVVRTEQEAEFIIANVKRYPVASMMLVQVLRHNEKSDDLSALFAESLAFSTLQGGAEFKAWLQSQNKDSKNTQAYSVDEPPVKIERIKSQLIITLNRPQQRNAYSTAMRDGLYEALSLLELDTELTSCVIRGEGACFCVGGDLDEFGSATDMAQAHVIRSSRNVAHLLIKHSEKISCEIHRASIGSGIELAAFAHYVTASKDTFFQLPELSMGLIPGAGGTLSILRRIGRQRLAWWVLSGKKIKSNEALKWGLVDQIS